MTVCSLGLVHIKILATVLGNVTHGATLAFFYLVFGISLVSA